MMSRQEFIALEIWLALDGYEIQQTVHDGCYRLYSSWIARYPGGQHKRYEFVAVVPFEKKEIMDAVKMHQVKKRINHAAFPVP